MNRHCSWYKSDDHSDNGHTAIKSSIRTKPSSTMASYFSITIVVLVACFGASMGGIVPAALAAPAPLVAAAPVAPIAAAPVFGYAKAVPQNIPPHASRIDLSTRTLAAPYVAAPYVGAPVAAPYIAGPAVAPAIAPAHLAYSPYTYPGNLAAPIVQPAILG